MARLSCILVQLILIIPLFSDVESTTKDYTAEVIAYPIENGQFRSGQQVPLLCIITPTPPFQVVYIWRSSTQNHDLTAIFPSIVPLTTLLISDNHPLFGRYFCHVLSADNHTTLAVGHVTIFPTGILQAVGTTAKPFTPPAPLELKAELQPVDSNLLNVLSSITYEWQHNGTELSEDSELVKSRQENSGFMINDSSLAIATTRPNDTGVYSVRIDFFSVLNFTNINCANRAFEALRYYAFFREVEFLAYNSKVPRPIEINALDLEPLPPSFVTNNVSYINGEPLVTIDTRIPLRQFHRNLILNPDTTFERERRVFYNGAEGQLPRGAIISGPDEETVLIERVAIVTLTLRSPTPEHEGVYEVQLFVDISQLRGQNCLDYIDFLRTSNGVNVPKLLVGSATLYIHQQDPPQVSVEATNQVLTSADGTEPLPQLTCSVLEHDRLPVNQLRWMKDGTVLAEVQDSRMLVFDTATNPAILSTFGLYMCEAIFTSQIKAENSVLIAERANFTMELEPINSTRCLNLSTEAMQLMLDILLEEMQFSFSYETGADFTMENFDRSSLICSPEGSNIIMSTDVIYSNSDGSITASALVEMAEEWMNGIRTANGAAFQIIRLGSGTTQSQNLQLGTQHLTAIVVSTVSFGVIIFGIIILVTCCIVIKRRKRSKKQKLAQIQKHNQLALPQTVNNSPAVVNHAFQQNEGSAQVLLTSMAHYDRLVEDPRSIPLLPHTMRGPPDIVPPAFSTDNPINYGTPNVLGRATLLPNVQGIIQGEEMVHPSLSVRENYAYNKRQDLSEMGHPRPKNEPANQNVNNDRIFFNQRQRSVHHYDYPTVNKEDLCARDTDSMGYQSVDNMTKD